MSATPKQFNPPDDAALIRSTDLLGDETCQTCKFWARIFSRAEDDDDWDWEEATRAAHMRDLHKGYCRRRAPIATGYRTWPQSYEDDYCGDYRPKLDGQPNARGELPPPTTKKGTA